MKKIFTEISVIACFLLLLLSDVAYAQNVTVKGVVNDDQNLPIPGVSIVIKGTTNGVQTDATGNYTISVPSNGTLVFSSIGFNNQEVLVNNRTTINIKLLSSTNDLQQVVVVGYGTQRKRDLTGSITSVSGEEIAKQPNVNPVSSLQGKVSGLTIVNSGSPGAAPTVRIRGIASVNSASPLYVVDGVHQSNIDYINPADIESIEVLKDASSVAIFGLQAANGVIVVTTKRAKMGTTTINLASSAGFQKVQNTIDVLNAAQFRTVYDKIRANAANPVPFDYSNYTADTDWQDEILQTAFQTNHNLTISNSGEKSTTLLSLGYNNQEGVLKFGKYQRYNARLNEEIKITKDIKVGADLTGSHWNLNGSNGSLNGALWAAPIVGIRESETAYYNMPSFQRAQVGNPVAAIYQNDRNAINKGYRFVGNLFGEVKFLKNFTWRSQVYTDLGFNNTRGYTPLPFTQINLGENGTPTEYFNNPNARTSVRQGAEEFRKFQQDHTLNYNNTLGDHSITGLVGLTTIYESSTSLSGSRTDTRLNVPDSPDFWYVGIIDPDNPTTLGGGGAERSSMGVFARANYAYKDRYLVNASIRRDGISRLSPQNRWGTFGSLGLGWVISEENFFKDIKGIDFLKLRGAWGVTGNAQGISDFIFLPGLNTSGAGVFGDIIYPSVSPAYLPDPNLRWERVRGLDLGFDLKALNNKLSAEVVYYDRKTIDIITSITLPGSTGVSSYRTNAGSITNKGLEVALGWTDNITKDLKYSISPNFSYNKNKVVSIGDNIDFLLTGNGGVNRTVSGESVGHFFGYRQIGIYQTVSQITNSPTMVNALPGDIIYADLNGDGQITELDRENLGSPFPTWNYGVNFTLAYKNFDFLLQGQGVAGNYIYTQRRVAVFSDLNLETNRLNAWDGAGTSNVEPILDKARGNNYRFSTYFLEPGDYFRIRTLQLGYTYRPKNSSGMMLKSIRMYLSGQNLHTWSKVSGYTPEVPISSILGGGADNGTYPVPAVYTFGINVTF